MDPTTAGLIGTGIGALVGLGGGWLNGWRQSKLEYEKWTRSRQDSIERDARLAFADLTKKIAAVIHAMAWLTWKAVNEPRRFSKNDLITYDSAIKVLFPDIVGSRVTLAALSGAIHDQISPLIQELYALDVKIAEAGVLYRDSVSEGIKMLVKCHSESSTFDGLFLKEVIRIGIGTPVVKTLI